MHLFGRVFQRQRGVVAVHVQGVRGVRNVRVVGFVRGAVFGVAKHDRQLALCMVKNAKSKRIQLQKRNMNFRQGMSWVATNPITYSKQK